MLPDGYKIKNDQDAIDGKIKILNQKDLLKQTIKVNFLRQCGLAIKKDGTIIICPDLDSNIQIWSSPFYAGYWSELNRDQEMMTNSIGPTLNQAIDDITNMPLERIWDLQIDSAIRTFSERLPQQKQNRAEWQDCAEVARAFKQGSKVWQKSKKVSDFAISRATPPSEAPQATDRSLSRIEKTK